MTRAGNQTKARIVRVDGAIVRESDDRLATEEPLEIRLTNAGGGHRSVAVTMRTPGHDFELAAGFLFAEGIVGERGEISEISYCVDRTIGEEQRFNIVNVKPAGHFAGVERLERHFVIASSCGVCGSAQIDDLAERGYRALSPGPRVSRATIAALPDRLRDAQRVFETTGGLHAAAAFTADGEAVVVREDVGRHNAVDKVLGHALLEGISGAAIGLVSGRASYEVMQKFLAGGVPIVCSVSAPSSLAVEVATRFGMTLVGFLRDGRFNVYAGRERISLED